jgi:hypothetical protein
MQIPGFGVDNKLSLAVQPSKQRRSVLRFYGFERFDREGDSSANSSEELCGKHYLVKLILLV